MAATTKVLVLGGSGMLGHKVWHLMGDRLVYEEEDTRMTPHGAREGLMTQ